MSSEHWWLENESSFYIWSPFWGNMFIFGSVLYISDQIHSSLLRAPQRWARLRCIGTRSLSSTETSIGNRKRIAKCLLYMSIYCLHCNPYSQHHYELLLHYCTLSYHICIIEYTKHVKHCKTLHSLYFYIQVNSNVYYCRWFTFFFLFPWHVSMFSGGLNSSKVKWEESTGATFAMKEEVLCTLHDRGYMVIGLSACKKRKDCIFKSVRWMRMAGVPFWKQQTTWRASSIYVKLLIIHQHQDPKHSLVERSSNREKLMFLSQIAA